MAKKKEISTRQKLINLIKDLENNPCGLAILYERLLFIADETKTSLKLNAASWAKGFIAPHLIEDWCDRVKKMEDQ